MKNQNEGNTRYNISSLEIMCVGTELLMGQIINTNAAFLARELTLTGIPSFYQTVVGDNPQRLENAIKEALKRSDAIILTGGLGPTFDDITMEIAAKAVGLALEFHEESADLIKSYFDKMHRVMSPSNLKQAMLPTGCIPLPNQNGTAPGAIIEIDISEDSVIKKKVLILLPGPPSEMRGMYDPYVKPYLINRAPVEIHSLFVRLFGIGESAAETVLKDLIESQTNPTMAPYCSEGECMFRISSTKQKKYTESFSSESLNEKQGEFENATRISQETAEDDLSNPTETPGEFKDILRTVQDRLGEYIYEIGDRNMQKVVFDLLDQSHVTVSFAESCTAGLATSMIGDIPGASRVLRGSVIAYNNEIKQTVLGLSEKILDKFGAVSKETALEMAKGCKDIMKSDYSVSITGIAGPDGGTDIKQVGLVYICISGPFSDEIKELHLTGSRSRIRTIASLNAYDLLRRTVLDDRQRKNG